MITIDGYPLDLVESEEHSLEAEITDYPVEDGSDISDNIRLKPRTLTLNGAVVSDTPIGTIASDSTRQNAAGTPSSDAYRFLEALYESRRAVVVVTGLKRYEQMVLETLTIPREAKDAGALVFTAHFKQIRTVVNKRVTMKLPNTGGEQNLGLSLDRIIAGKEVLWRHGKPPGSSPSTVPPGVITLTETVVVQDGGKKPSKYIHKATGKELTGKEEADFAKDLERDVAIYTNRRLARDEQQLNQIQSNLNQGLTPTERAQSMADYQRKHPGEKVDPEGFGLRPDGKGGFVSSGN